MLRLLGYNTMPSPDVHCILFLLTCQLILEMYWKWNLQQETYHRATPFYPRRASMSVLCDHGAMRTKASETQLISKRHTSPENTRKLKLIKTEIPKWVSRTPAAHGLLQTPSALSSPQNLAMHRTTALPTCLGPLSFQVGKGR